MNKKTLTALFVTILVIMVVTYLILSSFFLSPKDQNEPLSVSLHSLSFEEATSLNESGVTWIRIDINQTVKESLDNAKAYNLNVLGILDSWTMNYNLTFTIDEWIRNVTYYVSSPKLDLCPAQQSLKLTSPLKG